MVKETLRRVQCIRGRRMIMGSRRLNTCQCSQALAKKIDESRCIL